MSDILKWLANFLQIRLVPTVKRMLDRRRLPYTLLTVGLLLISAAALSLLVCSTAEALAAHDSLAADYAEYLLRTLTAESKRSPIPEMPLLLAQARAERISLSILGGLLWLLAAMVALGRVMTAVMDAEAYVYGLFMIYGADRKQLTRQLTMEFLLAGIPALGGGLPLGYGLFYSIGGRGDFPAKALWLMAACFILLILLCASLLARRMLGRSCMRLLNAADTSDVTVSPRRSSLHGLKGRRGVFTSSLLAMWRMRRHYGSLALVILLISASVFGILSPEIQALTRAPAFTLELANGVTLSELSDEYVYPLSIANGVASLEYSATDTAKALGSHVLTNHSGIDGHEGLRTEDLYATSEFRVACGDGETFYELGGNLVLPSGLQNVIVPSNKDFGYKLEAVPEGCAVYVYPEGQTPPLSLQVGSTVRLELPSADGGADRLLTVRISNVVEVNHLRGERGGPVICPRITEDYLYLSPMDYEKLDGKTHVRGFTAEEALPEVFFPDDEPNTCVLVMPLGASISAAAPTHVTVISPEETIREPFRDRLGKESLPDHTYFINHTAHGVGIYLGTKEEYAKDGNAAEALSKHIRQALQQYVGTTMPATVTTEYRVRDIIYAEKGSSPYLILPHTEEVNYSALQNDLCAFRLSVVNQASPLMTTIAEEAFLLETDSLFGSAYYGRTCYIGTTLLPDFVTAMEREGLHLQFSKESFLHTKTIIRTGFSLENAFFLLADLYPFSMATGEPPLQSDSYPRMVTGVGSFCPVGDVDEISFLAADALGMRGLFNGASIGQLKSGSTVVPGQVAYDGWYLSPLGEALPSSSPERGHAILVVQDPDACPIRPGEVVAVAHPADTAAFLHDPQYMSLNLRGEDLLPYLLERVEYTYTDFIVDGLQTGDVTTLVLNEADMAAILNRRGLYKDLEVFLTPDISVNDYMTLHKTITQLSKSPHHSVTLAYEADHIIRARTSAEASRPVLPAMGYISLCMIPLLILVSQLVFYEKRAEEFRILDTVGISRGGRRRRLLAESALTACLLAVCAAAACPLGYLLVLILTDLTGATFHIPPLDLFLCGGITLLTALSCILAGLLASRMVIHRRKNTSQRQSRRSPSSYEQTIA